MAWETIKYIILDALELHLFFFLIPVGNKKIPSSSEEWDSLIWMSLKFMQSQTSSLQTKIWDLGFMKKFIQNKLVQPYKWGLELNRMISV